MLNRLFRQRPTPHQLAGICISEHGVSAAVVVRPPGQTPRLSWAQHYASAALPSTLQEIARQQAVRTSRCAGMVATGDYNLVLLDAPDVPPAEMREAVRWKVNEFIDFHVDDAVIDIFDVPRGSDSHAPRVYAVAARRSAVGPLAQSLVSAGIKLEYIDIPEFALRNLAALLPEDQGGVATVALDANRGLIAVTRQGNLYLSRRLDYGTQRLLPAQARHAITAENEGAMDTLVIEIQRSLDYYERHFAQPAIQAVILTPCGFPLDAAAGYLQSQLGIPVRPLALSEIITIEPSFTAEHHAQCYAAIGIALRQEERAL